MSLLIFIIILSALVIVHEMGHLVAAKRFGVKVDEFGLGYPPKAKKLFRWKGTDFTLNWLPFGGFVKIVGENPDDTNSHSPDSFQTKNRAKQAAILAAGVFFNLLFAWLLVSFGFMTGIAAPAGLSFQVSNTHTVVTTVLPGSPAATAGLKSGDIISSLERAGESLQDITPETAADFVSQSLDPITFNISRGQENSSKVVYPEEGIIAGRPAVGISMDIIGTAKLNPLSALWQGFLATVNLVTETSKALGKFFWNAVTGHANLSAVTGPVGLVGMVGDVRQLGFSYLLTFTALISVNLAVINLLPFPALDGGRILFVALEAITRRKIPPKIFNAINTIGFALLIILMVLITIRDVRYIL